LRPESICSDASCDAAFLAPNQATIRGTLGAVHALLHLPLEGLPEALTPIDFG
jgi:hypothetical protein